MEILPGILAFASAAAMLYALLKRRPLVGGALAYLCLLSVTWFVLGRNSEGYWRPPPADPLADSRPHEDPFDGYVSSDTCRSCHPGEYHSWHATYHRTMTQVASPESVLATGFDGRTFVDGGLAFTLEQRGQEIWTRIRPADPLAAANAPVIERRFVMTTGSHNYQVYWLDGDYQAGERPDDRQVTIFPFVYLLQEKEWVPRMEAFVTPPYDDLNSLHSGDWNRACINCHATHGALQSRSDSDVLTTRAAEFGIACEACHGPAAEHIAANQNPLRRYLVRHETAGGARDPTIVNPAKLDHERSTQVCGQCHGLSAGFREVEDYTLHGYGFRPGQNLDDTFVRSRLVDWQTHPALQQELAKKPGMLRDLFWPDGMVRVTGRELNGLLETKCYQEGDMSCLSCHDLHKADADPRPLRDWADDQLAPGRRTNAACLQCHETYATDAALTAHTHHQVSSSGSSCYNCHMPHTTFGLLRAIRSHTIDSPDVARTVATGRPNACNQCHLDQTLDWTARALHDWYGTPMPELTADERNIAASVIWALKGDAGQRALMAWSLGWDEARRISGDDWTGVYLAFLLEDSYAAVRLVARRSLMNYPGFASLPPYPFPPDVKNRAFALWKQQHPAGLPAAPATVLLRSDGTFNLEPAYRLMRERDLTPINLKE